MPHTKNRGARKPSTYHVKISKKQAKQTLREQQNLARHIISVNAFHDRITGERVNTLPPDEIIKQITATYPQAPPEAIPTVQDGSVLTIPNRYHLELFSGSNLQSSTYAKTHVGS